MAQKSAALPQLSRKRLMNEVIMGDIVGESAYRRRDERISETGTTHAQQQGDLLQRKGVNLRHRISNF